MPEGSADKLGDYPCYNPEKVHVLMGLLLVAAAAIATVVPLLLFLLLLLLLLLLPLPLPLLLTFALPPALWSPLHRTW